MVLESYGSDGYYYADVFVLDRKGNYYRIATPDLQYAASGGGWVYFGYVTDKKAKITLDVNGGTMAYNSSTVYIRDAGGCLGYLPMAEKKDCNFYGWYTEPIGGERVDWDTPVTSNMRYYAHYYGKGQHLYSTDRNIMSYVDESLTTRGPNLYPGIKSYLAGRKSALEKSFDFNGKRVLLVEDNELNREIATEWRNSCKI